MTIFATVNQCKRDSTYERRKGTDEEEEEKKKKKQNV
jgi:hypothetical protein